MTTQKHATYDGMLAEVVPFKGHNGDTIYGYAARPMGPGSFGSVVVLHHAPGWDEASKEITRKFAYHGYSAICPHLYHREDPAITERTQPTPRLRLLLSAKPEASLTTAALAT